MDSKKITQCDACGVILDQKQDLDLASNIVLLCVECYYKRVLQSGLDGLPIINDYVSPEVLH